MREVVVHVNISEHLRTNGDKQVVKPVWLHMMVVVRTELSGIQILKGTSSMGLGIKKKDSTISLF